MAIIYTDALISKTFPYNKKVSISKSELQYQEKISIR